MSLSEVRIERLTGFQDPIGQMQQFTHDGDDNLFRLLAVGLQALGKGAQHRIVLFGNQGGILFKNDRPRPSGR